MKTFEHSLLRLSYEGQTNNRSKLIQPFRVIYLMKQYFYYIWPLRGRKFPAILDHPADLSRLISGLAPAGRSVFDLPRLLSRGNEFHMVWVLTHDGDKSPIFFNYIVPGLPRSLGAG